MLGELRLASTRGRCCLWKGTHGLGFCQPGEGNSAFPPLLRVPSPCPMSELAVPGPWVHFVRTLGAALYSVELQISCSSLFSGPFHHKNIALLSLVVSFPAVSRRTKLLRVSHISRYLLGRPVPGGVMGSASFRHRYF